jgi:hypothetical protein
MITLFLQFICWISGGHHWIKDQAGLLEYCKDCGKIKPAAAPQAAGDSQP